MNEYSPERVYFQVEIVNLLVVSALVGWLNGLVWGVLTAIILSLVIVLTVLSRTKVGKRQTTPILVGFAVSLVPYLVVFVDLYLKYDWMVPLGIIVGMIGIVFVYVRGKAISSFINEWV